MNDLMRALRFPWRDAGWFGRLLPLALLQLIPIIGQLILLGYGQAVARATLGQQTGLPKLQLSRSLLDGLRLAAVGFIYFLPVFLMVVLVLSLNGTSETETSGSVVGLLLPFMMLVFMPIIGAIGKQHPALKPIISAVSALIGVVFAVFIISRLWNLLTTLRDGFQFSAIQLDATKMPLLLVAALLMAFVVVALLVSGVQFAVTGGGLLNPNATLRLMATERSLTVRFAGTVWLFIAGTVVATMIGTLLLVLPGLLLWVAGSVAIWSLAAQYARKIGIGVPAN